MPASETVLPEASAIVLAHPLHWLSRATADWLLARVLAQVGALSQDVIVVSRERLALPSARVLVEHEAWELQPWVSIRLALGAMRGERGLVVGADMPMLNAPLLRYMLLLSEDFEVIVPRVNGQIDPLLAVYGRSVLPALDELIVSGARLPLRFFERCDVRYIDQDEVEILDLQRYSLVHVENDDDAREARQIIRQRSDDDEDDE